MWARALARKTSLLVPTPGLTASRAYGVNALTKGEGPPGALSHVRVVVPLGTTTTTTNEAPEGGVVRSGCPNHPSRRNPRTPSDEGTKSPRSEAYGLRTPLLRLLAEPPQEAFVTDPASRRRAPVR